MPQRNTRFQHEPTRASLGQRSGMRSLCLFLNEDHMATRNDNDQNKAADEAARTARTVTDEAARVGEQTARAGADIANRSTEATRNAVEAGTGPTCTACSINSGRATRSWSGSWIGSPGPSRICCPSWREWKPWAPAS